MSHTESHDTEIAVIQAGMAAVTAIRARLDALEAQLADLVEQRYRRQVRQYEALQEEEHRALN